MNRQCDLLSSFTYLIPQLTSQYMLVAERTGWTKLQASRYYILKDFSWFTVIRQLLFANTLHASNLDLSIFSVCYNADLTLFWSYSCNYFHIKCHLFHLDKVARHCRVIFRFLLFLLSTLSFQHFQRKVGIN